MSGFGFDEGTIFDRYFSPQSESPLPEKSKKSPDSLEERVNQLQASINQFPEASRGLEGRRIFQTSEEGALTDDESLGSDSESREIDSLKSERKSRARLTLEIPSSDSYETNSITSVFSSFSNGRGKKELTLSLDSDHANTRGRKDLTFSLDSGYTDSDVSSMGVSHGFFDDSELFSEENSIRPIRLEVRNSTNPESYSNLGAIQKETVAFIHDAAKEYFSKEKEKTVLELSQEQNVLARDSTGSLHHFSAVPLSFDDQKVVGLVDLSAVAGKGANKIVNPAVVGDKMYVITRSPMREEAYSRVGKKEEIAGINQIVAEALTGAEVVARMCSFKNTPNVVAPHMIVTLGDDDRYSELAGGLLFDAMDGDYSSVFKSEIQPHLDDPIQFKRAINLFRDGSNGLCNIHAEDLMHGDVRPTNFMFKKLENGKEEGGVTDLDGLSRPMYTNYMRTISYLSPQALKMVSSETYDWKKDDVWSYGLTCFELITGKNFCASLGVLPGEMYLSQDLLADQEKINNVIDTMISEKIPHAQDLKELLKRAICVDGSDRADIAEIYQRFEDLLILL